MDRVASPGRLAGSPHDRRPDSPTSPSRLPSARRTGLGTAAASATAPRDRTRHAYDRSPRAAGMRLVGHRGCPDHAPENTIDAVRTAAPHVDAVEVDARRCATGEVVVFHDERLDRLTRASGRVAETPWRTLRDLRVRGPGDDVDRDGTGAADGEGASAGDAVPRLADLLAAVPDDVAVNVELKTDGLAGDVVALARAADQRVFVSSFEADRLRAVRERDPALPVAALVVDDWEGGLALARELDADYLHPHHATVTADRVATARAAGLTVNAWTVRSPDEVPPLRAAGVDGVVADSWTVLDG